MIELFPEGFEEVEDDGGVEFVAYTNAGGEERLLQTFGNASGRDVEDGWEERWRAFHRATRVGSLWIGPPWLEPDSGATPVAIEPGQAFGTGGHPTTRLCLELVLEEARGSLVDLGCGSGVIAVAAAKLGFSPVIAIDNDPLAVEATLRNAAANGVLLEAKRGDVLSGPMPAADLAVANISIEAIGRLSDRFVGGRVITSGYLANDEPRLAGYRHLARRSDVGWVADVYVREE